LQLGPQHIEAFYQFCFARDGGATTEDLTQNGWNAQQILPLANALLSQGRLNLVQIGPGQLMYQAIDQSSTAKFRGLEGEHLLVYQTVDKSGDKGVWSKALKDQTGLQQHTITKVTKELMRRGLIKEVKSVQHRGRKVFMLAEIEPDKSVSGGTWYHDGEFARDWVETLREHCKSFLESHSGKVVSLSDVHAYIQQQPGPSAPTADDVQAIMRTLELDEVIYSVQTGEGHLVYTQRDRGANGAPFDLFAGRMPSWMMPERKEQTANGLVVPCLLCPLKAECHPGGRVCPERCEYIDRWVRHAGPSRRAPGADAKVNDW